MRIGINLIAPKDAEGVYHLDLVRVGGKRILGGMGYSAETDMQRYWRDARLLKIGPVSNEMAQNMIAEGLGLPRSF